MIFQSFDLRLKKWLLLFLLLLFAWWLFSAGATCSAASEQRTYTITEEELVTLENSLARLKAINSKLQLESKTQNTQAKALQEQVQLLQSQLTALKQESERQQELLTAANRSLEEYAIAAKKERLRIKAQRNTWACATVAVIVAAACR